MNEIALPTFRIPSYPWGLTCFVVFICICVVAQMLGMPVTLLGLLDTDRLMTSEPGSEDPSVLASTLELEMPRFLRFFTESGAGVHLPVLLTSVFRPPLL
jgi:hypothetical protein